MNRVTQTWVLRGRLRHRSLSSSSCSSSSSSSSSSEKAGDSAKMIEVWAWGKGDSGQLGAGDDKNHRKPHLIARIQPPPNLHLAPMQGLSAETPLSSIFSNVGCTNNLSSSHHLGKEDLSSLMHCHQGNEEGSPSSVGVSCGLFHSALILDGEMWTWGKGEAGRLGLGSEVPKYGPVSNPHLENVHCLALGGLHSAATTADGKLYTWGFGAFGALGHGRYKAELLPRRLLLQKDKEDKVAYVAAGGSHSAAITSSGELYTWGRDEGDGRLGQGDELVTDEGAVNVPLHVYLMPEPVKAVSCGGFFTMALSCGGKAWSWGANANYELGRGDNHARCKPTLIPELENMHIVQVACGGYHSVVLTDDGKVLTWGRGGDGQLGHGSWGNGKTPQVVEALSHLRIVYIACGSFSTAAITDTGILYCWGKNKDHQLGFPGKMDAENIPTKVTFNQSNDSEQDKELSVISVAMGACHGIGVVLH